MKNESQPMTTPNVQTLTIDNGWLDNATICCSSHYNQRPLVDDISLLVIHNISLPPGQFGGGYINDLFLGRLDCQADPFFSQLEGLRVSAHCMISRTGIITQYVSFEDRAWHAGISTYNGRTNCNDFSIGIELEGTDTTLYTSAQYEALAKVTKVLCRHYRCLTPQTIVGHCDIAPGRKTDPGDAFDWSHYGAMLE